MINFILCVLYQSKIFLCESSYSYSFRIQLATFETLSIRSLRNEYVSSLYWHYSNLFKANIAHKNEAKKKQNKYLIVEVIKKCCFNVSPCMCFLTLFLFQNSYSIKVCMILVFLSSLFGYCKEVIQIFQQVNNAFHKLIAKHFNMWDIN